MSFAAVAASIATREISAGTIEMFMSREYRRQACLNRIKRDERWGIAYIVGFGIVVACLVIFVGLYPKV